MPLLHAEQRVLLHVIRLDDDKAKHRRHAQRGDAMIRRQPFEEPAAPADVYLRLDFAQSTRAHRAARRVPCGMLRER